MSCVQLAGTYCFSRETSDIPRGTLASCITVPYILLVSSLSKPINVPVSCLSMSLYPAYQCPCILPISVPVSCLSVSLYPAYQCPCILPISDVPCIPDIWASPSMTLREILLRTWFLDYSHPTEPFLVYSHPTEPFLNYSHPQKKMLEYSNQTKLFLNYSNTTLQFLNHREIPWVQPLNRAIAELQIKPK